MKTYISDIIPKIQRFSQELDNLTLLTNQHWVVIEEINESKTVYIFRKNGELLISQNGRVEKAKWEYLGHNSLLIDRKQDSYLFRHGFFDENILALKIDSKNEYAFLVNESKFERELNSIDTIKEFLKDKYLDPQTRRTINLTAGDNLSTEPKRDYIAPGHNSRNNGEETSFSGIVSDRIIIEFNDTSKGEVFVNRKNGQAFFRGKPEGYWINVQYLYEDKVNCINALHYFLKTKQTLQKGLIGAY
jgi:hypothetical protein